VLAAKEAGGECHGLLRKIHGKMFCPKRAFRIITHIRGAGDVVGIWRHGIAAYNHCKRLWRFLHAERRHWLRLKLFVGDFATGDWNCAGRTASDGGRYAYIR